jgi:hypothetical protein
MGKKSLIAAITISLVLLSIVAGMQVVEVAKANPIPWSSTPNLEKPTLQIETPQNYTEYNEGSVSLNFTVHQPDSWNYVDLVIHYVGEIKSIDSYLDGIHYGHYPSGDNLTRISDGIYYEHYPYGSDLTSYSDKLTVPASGLHVLNITICGSTYYEGPLYSNSSIPIINTTGITVYDYPVVVSDIVYFTVEREQSPSLSPNVTAAPSSNLSSSPSPTQQQTLEPSITASPTPTAETSNPNLSLEIAVTVVIVIAVAGLLVYFRKR